MGCTRFDKSDREGKWKSEEDDRRVAIRHRGFAVKRLAGVSGVIEGEPGDDTMAHPASFANAVSRTIAACLSTHCRAILSSSSA